MLLQNHTNTCSRMNCLDESMIRRWRKAEEALRGTMKKQQKPFRVSGQDQATTVKMKKM